MTTVQKKRDLLVADWIRALSKIVRGQVLLVDLRGAERREQEKTRPCVVLSNDRQNQRHETLVVAPITSLDGRGARIYEVHLSAGEGGLPNDSAALPHQIRTIDRQARVVEIW